MDKEIDLEYNPKITHWDFITRIIQNWQKYIFISHFTRSKKQQNPNPTVTDYTLIIYCILSIHATYGTTELKTSYKKIKLCSEITSAFDNSKDWQYKRTHLFYIDKNLMPDSIQSHTNNSCFWKGFHRTHCSQHLGWHIDCSIHQHQREILNVFNKKTSPKLRGYWTFSAQSKIWPSTDCLDPWDYFE